MKRTDKAKDRSKRAVELLGREIDLKISELTESNRQLKRKIFDLYTIFEISRNFNTVLNYDILVDSFLLTALGQVGASTAALYFPAEPRSRYLTLVKAKGLNREDGITQVIDRSGMLASRLIAVGRPQMTEELRPGLDASGDVRLAAAFPDGLVLPLILKSHLRGILFLGGKVSGTPFGTDDIEFLSTLANQFVVAVENARLYESEKQALEELKIAQEQLVHSERLAAIGELSAKIAHEVNNPLSIISNYLHLCERNLGDPELSRRHLDVVRQELGRIAGIIRQLLDFHRPHKAERIPIKIAEVMEEVLRLVEYQLAQKNITVIREYDSSLPLICGSPEQLKQVFLNLIINARDFMPGGGRLTVEIRRIDRRLKVAVGDTGPGIPVENLPRVFEPFFTTKEDGSGTGLGLSVCYGIINEHGGRIEAGNLPQGGSCFSITLPIKEESCQDAE